MLISRFYYFMFHVPSLLAVNSCVALCVFLMRVCLILIKLTYLLTYLLRTPGTTGIRTFSFCTSLLLLVLFLVC